MLCPETGHYRKRSRQGQKNTSTRQQVQEEQQEPSPSPTNPPAAGRWCMFQTKVSRMRIAGTWLCWRSWTACAPSNLQHSSPSRQLSKPSLHFNIHSFLFSHSQLKLIWVLSCIILCYSLRTENAPLNNQARNPVPPFVMHLRIWISTYITQVTSSEISCQQLDIPSAAAPLTLEMTTAVRWDLDNGQHFTPSGLSMLLMKYQVSYKWCLLS